MIEIARLGTVMTGELKSYKSVLQKCCVIQHHNKNSENRTSLEKTGAKIISRVY